MAFITYAQNFEDVMLWRALQHIQNGFYIDVGAAWPDVHSVTKAFHLRGWRGINIDPNPEFYSQLCKLRPDDHNIQVAISSKEGEVELRLFPETGLSTLDVDIANEHIKSNYNCIAIQVPASTLANVLRSDLPKDQEIHFLKIDVEGLEGEVLSSNDWSIFRPWIVLVESTLPLSKVETHHAWEPSLIDAAYTFAYADGLNRFYVENSHLDLLAAFKYPPNVFDEFTSEPDAKTEALELELMAVLTSKSWQITKPLRTLTALARKLKKTAKNIWTDLSVLHPRRMIVVVLKNTKSLIYKNSALESILLVLLNKFPRLKYRIAQALKSTDVEISGGVFTSEPNFNIRLAKIEKVVASSISQIEK